MNKLLYLKVKNLFNKTKSKYISSKVLYEGKFIRIISEVYKLPNKKIIERERVEKNNNKQSVIIISITEDNKFLLVVQNRINRLTSMEFPSGYIEKNETIKEAAKRELEEETGYTTNEIIFIDSYYSQLGIDASVVNIVLAKNCVKSKGQKLGVSEYIKFHEFSFKELCTLISENYIKGCGNKLAFYEFLNYSDRYYYKNTTN